MSSQKETLGAGGASQVRWVAVYGIHIKQAENLLNDQEKEKSSSRVKMTYQQPASAAAAQPSPLGFSQNRERAARLWLAVVVATLWLLSMGGRPRRTSPPSTLPDLTAVLGQARRQRRAMRLWLVSIFHQSWNLLLGALLNQRRLPTGRFVPKPWPSVAEEETKLKEMHEVLLAA
jgi:hypothetical protein